MKPDVIIVWGYGLFDRLYGLGETDGEEMSLTNGDKVMALNQCEVLASMFEALGLVDVGWLIVPL